MPAVPSATPLVVLNRPSYVPILDAVNGVGMKLACNTMLLDMKNTSGFWLVVMLPLQPANTSPAPAVAVRVTFAPDLMSLPLSLGDTLPVPLLSIIKTKV